MKNEVIVCPTKRGSAYTIRINIYGRTFTMGTGGYGLTYEKALEEGKDIADRMHVDFSPCERSNLSIDRYPPK